MPDFIPQNNRVLWAVVGVALLALAAQAQTPSRPSPSPEQDDVIRVNTELVQTDVMVFDKKGHFVDGLKAEDFALKVDNKPQTISFFDRVISRKGSEQNGANAAGTGTSPTGPTATAHGRTVIFFVDDLHLAPDSLDRTRKALVNFVDKSMGTTDQVAITSSSGQIGFLQQFTNDRAALLSAVARLNYKAETKIDMQNPPMSEYIAQKIRDGDQNALNYYVSELQKQSCYKVRGAVICPVSVQSMRLMVRERAQEMGVMSKPATDNTLIMLEGLMRTAAQLPGRKVVFMISDGFYLDERVNGGRGRIKRITDAAGRAGVVINTLDARGIISESLSVTNDRPLDQGGWLTGVNIGEVTASQDGMNALAGDTGGRAFRNTNAPMAEFVDKILDEIGSYYLLAWRPDPEEQKRGKFNRIEASIIGRPDLTVRMRNAYFKTAPLPILSLKKKSDKDPEKAREDDMRIVIDAPVSQLQIPTSLELTLSQMPGVGTQVTATIHITREALTFDTIEGKPASDLDIGGIFYDDKGKPLSSFVGRLRVFQGPAPTAADKRSPAVYAFHAWLPTGLFQVRVGVRDIRNGRIGSAMQWIEIPRIK